MKEIICYTTKIACDTEQIIPFIEILLDDTWADENIIYPENIYEDIGDFNQHLTQKQSYEFLLRAAFLYPFKAIGISSISHNMHKPIPQIDTSNYNWECFQTDCYVTAKYVQELKSAGYYTLVLENLMNCAMTLPSPEEGFFFMKKMLSYSAEYYYIDDNTQSILIYYPTDFCYAVVRSFSQLLVKGLRQCHQKVEIIDFLSIANNIKDFSMNQYIGRHFKAIIGFHDKFFSTQNDTCYLHDLLIGPKYNFLFDHPVSVRDSLIFSSPQNYYLLLLDRNYVNFSNRYYKKYISGCYHFPPTGIYNEKSNANAPRIYDVSFIGSYKDYRQTLYSLYSLPAFDRHLAARFLLYMKKEPSLSAENAFQKCLAFYGLELNDADFELYFSRFYYLSITISQYFREKVIDTLLNAGITINLFGDSWKNAPCTTYPNCILHANISSYNSMKIFQQSKISLNIMSWHKDGFTERIANALFNHSVVVTDTTTYLQENFDSNRDLILFNLDDFHNLPTKINELLANPELLNTIAHNGYHRALEHHLEIHRAEQLLNIIEASLSQ